MGRAVPKADCPIGPTINGVIDCRDQLNPLDGYVIEEGTVPESLVPILRSMLQAMPGKIYPEQYGPIQQLRHMLSSLEARLLGNYTPSGSTERTQIYLIMSHDSNQAILTLEDNKPALRFLGVGRSDHVAFLNNKLAEATSAVGGICINNPFFAAFGQQEVRIHLENASAKTESLLTTHRSRSTQLVAQILVATARRLAEPRLISAKC